MAEQTNQSDNINSKLRIAFDLDKTICHLKKSNQKYEDVEPLPGAVETIQELKKAGWYIVISTARNMRTFEHNVGKVNAIQTKIIVDWLTKWEIPFDELWVKPHVSGFVDDKAIEFKGDWEDTKKRIYELAVDEDAQFISYKNTNDLWTDEEITFLKQNWKNLYIQELPYFFPNRTVSSIKSKVKTFKLKREHRKVFFQKKYINDYLGGYFTGLFDGEGHFGVSVKKSKKLKRSNYNPKIVVGLRKDDEKILFEMQKYFGCGTIKYSFTETQNPKVIYTVGSLYDIKSKIIPHFEKYPLKAKKYNDYKVWKSLCDLQEKYYRQDWDESIRNQAKNLYGKLKDLRKYLAINDKINDKIDSWHKSKSNQELYEYLGWTFEEYADYIESNKIPERENVI